MNCKFCNAQVDDDSPVCPVCGKEMTAGDCLVTDREEQSLHAPKKNVARLVLSIVAAVLALILLAVVLSLALGVDYKSIFQHPNDVTNPGDGVTTTETDLEDKAGGDFLDGESYSVTADEAVKQGNTVIATMGGKELTNAHLQIYYRMQVLDFLNYYGGYIEQLGLDLSLPLSQQSCYFEAEKSWEQYFLDIAIETWQNYQVIALLAEEADFHLNEEWLQSLEKMPEDLMAQAKEAGHDSVDALLKDVIGPACTEELYMDYVRLAYTSNAYYGTINEQMTPTDEEILAYFEENAEAFSENGISKEMGNIADVRHILVCPKNGTKDETTGLTTYSDEEWKACLARAEDILAEWKSGDATEESFAELATTYTEDTGSAAIGGLYEDIAPGSNYVPNFLSWAIDMNRQTGDTEIVKTEFGYHIMYYVSGEPYWKTVVGTQQLSERITAMTEDAEARWPIDINYNKIAMSELEFS